MTRKSAWLWGVALAGASILAVNMGVRQTFGLYVAPVSQDLGLGREVFSLAIAVMNLAWGAASPFAGALVDKHGPRPVIIAGSALYAAGIFGLATAASESALLLSGALIGVGIAATGFSAVLGVVGRSVPAEKRQTALSLATMGSAFGQFIALPIAHGLTEAHGWAVSLMALAAITGMMAPLAFFMPGAPQAQHGGSEQSLREALSEAARHRGFWLLTAGFFVCGFHIAVVAVHLPAFLVDQGFSPQLGVAALMAVGLANIVGSYACGRAGDFMEKRLALTLIYAGRAVLFLGFLLAPLSEAGVMVFATLLGLLWLGTIPLTSGLLVTFFGPKWLSMLYGVVFLSHQVGSFLGAWLGGRIYDMLQSYDAMWQICVALGVAAALLNWPIVEKPVMRTSEKAAT